MPTYCKSQTARDILISKSKTTTMTTLSQKDLEDLDVPCPPLNEQEGIVKLMDLVYINLKLSHLDKLISLRKKLTNSILSGELLIPTEAAN